MIESFYEINEETYQKLLGDNQTLKNFGYQVACNSMFKPYQYGFYGCRLFQEDGRFYLGWKRRAVKDV